MLNFTFSNQFKKDLKLLEKRRYDMDAIFDIIGKIIWEEPLPKECREHGLSGNWAGFTECHIGFNWIMIYRFEPDSVFFVLTGTHSDLF